MKILKSELNSKCLESLLEIAKQYDEDQELLNGDFEIHVESIEPPKILYHYTSLSTLIAILSQVEESNDGNFIFRGSQIEYLKDWSEFCHGAQVLTDFIKEYEDQNPEIEKISYRINSKKWKSYITLGSIATSPFITSFSKNNDSLPMWNMYGDNGQGVAIGMESSIFEKLNYEKTNTPNLIRCRYSFHEFKNILNEIKGIGGILYKIFEKDGIITFQSLNRISLLNAICAQKHESYEYEKEWRLIKQCSNWDQKKEIFINDRTHFPYIENKIPISAIKEIVVGPCKDLELTKNIIEIALQRAGIELKDDKIIKSQAPYRNI